MGLLTFDEPIAMWTRTILLVQGRSKLSFWVGLVLVVSAVVFGVVGGCVREEDLTTDQRVYQLSTQLMCPVCDGQTLDQSQAQLSLDMQEVIRRKVEDGESNAEIREYFVERYGEVVLASPDAGGFNLVVWVMPVVIFVGGALLVGNAFLNMRRQRRSGNGKSVKVKAVNDVEATGVDVDDSVDGSLGEYLERADREMTVAIGRREMTEGGDKG